jgi:hypothetical protein
MTRLSLIFVLTQLDTALAACVFLPQKGINYDKVKGYKGAPKVPPGVAGELIKKFQPYLYVESGCVPFPAANSEGELK